MAGRVRQWARSVKRDTLALYLAGRDPRVPWYAKLLAAAVAGYALSPLDLVPDFIPVIGLLDDIVIVPLGIVIVIRLIPPEIMAEHRAAATAITARPGARMATAAIVAIWIVLTGIAAGTAAAYLLR